MDFLNDLGRMINQAARTFSPKNREDSGAPVVHSFGFEEVELNRRLAELGSAYYRTVIGDKAQVDPALIERVREAREALDARAAAVAERTVRCPYCGAAHDLGARFCSNCGKAMPEKPAGDDAAEEPDDTLEYCPECGANRREGEKFCAVCGRSFDTESPAAEADESAELPKNTDAAIPGDAPEEPDDAERYDE